MHYTECGDSVETESWQYVADFERLPDLLAAQRVYQQLNLQILGCPYQASPETLLHFLPLPLSQLPPTLPDGFEVASLYELPHGNVALGAVMLMVGLEKTKSSYRVSLMVDFSVTKSSCQ